VGSPVCEDLGMLEIREIKRRNEILQKSGERKEFKPINCRAKDSFHPPKYTLHSGPFHHHVQPNNVHKLGYKWGERRIDTKRVLMGPRGVRASCKEEEKGERERERKKTLDAGEKWERIGPEKIGARRIRLDGRANKNTTSTLPAKYILPFPCSRNRNGSSVK